MSTLEQLRHGIQHAVASLAEGWQQLKERAGHALTRFAHHRRGDGPEQQLMADASRWGLIPAEVKEEKDKLIVRMEIPGMEPDQFDIQIVGDTLVVRGEKLAEREESGGHYYLLERAYGAFERAIPLPVPVDENRAEARYRNGVLTLVLPKASGHLSRRIPIRTA
ncbi:HSP20 family protein [Methylomarinovum caldicuralii]|uniref:HSP20 family protein n=1 Tax=Methylomarinovum caldicuralii TaxID=438856 RepID=A0AAU9BZ59_9GAMM|nr:Hsp20/alpha crystallin family protein [Methylomarinovum caldicuralii]BCX81625.1 HSP20 family protein [Methylomarinovum caldicuralii]